MTDDNRHAGKYIVDLLVDGKLSPLKQCVPQEAGKFECAVSGGIQTGLATS